MCRKFANLAAVAVALFAFSGCLNEQEQLKLFAANAEEVDTALGVLTDVDAENAEIDNAVAADVPQAPDGVDAAAEVVPPEDAGDAQDGADIEQLDSSDAVDAAIPCTPSACDDDNACTEDKCADNACIHVDITGACDDVDGCTTGDKCVKGVCTGVPVYAAAVEITTPDEQGFRGGVLLADGSIVAAEYLGVKDKVTSRVVSLDVNGLNKVIDVKLDALPLESVWGIIADGGGFALTGSASGIGQDVLLARVSGTGAIQLQTPIDLGGDEEAYGLAKIGNNYAIFGGRSSPSPSQAFLVFVDSKGSCVNKDCKGSFYNTGDKTDFNQANGLAVRKDGSYWLVGESLSGAFGNTDAVLWHIAADGSELKHKIYGGGGPDSFYGVHVNADETAVLFGLKNNVGWLVGVDAKGEELWQATLPGTTVVNDLVPAAFGWTVAASVANAQRLIGVDAIGNILWQRDYLGRPTRLLVTKSGYAIVGDKETDASVTFTDPWGFDSCAAAKECLNVASCSDNIACTDDICDSVKGCVHTQAADLQPCGLGDACIGQSLCAVGKCTPGKVADCNDKNLCTDDSCDKAKGCVNLANAVSCDDADACTSSDICAASVCAGIANDVTITCNDSDDCTADICDAKTGCAHSKQTGTACDDGNFCTSGDACLKGNCTGASVVCNDSNICTDDSCAPLKGCIYTANTAGCDDASACTSADACAGAKCAGKVADCDDKNGCTDDSCDKLKGCVNLANAATCSDGDACTVADGCALSKCAPGAALKCDDGNACTDDSCDKLKGCLNVANVKGCDDGDACTNGDLCAAGKCVAKAVDCDDKNVCTDDSCDKLKGCLNLAVKDGVVCADGSSCTVGDACFGGKCVGLDAIYEHTSGGDADDYFLDVTPTSDGGLILAGTSKSKQITNYDGWIVRVKPDGSKLDEFWYGDDGYQRIHGVTALPDGGFAFGGGGESGSASWLARADAQGVVKMTGDPQGGTGWDSIVADGLGGFVVAGANVLQSPYLAEVARFDAAGKILWKKFNFGSYSSSDEHALIAVPSGGYAFVGGGCCKGGGATLNRLDASGNLLWQKQFGAPYEPRAVSLRSNGGFLVSGLKTLSGDGKNNDAWIAAVDLYGTQQWQQVTSTPADDGAFAGIEQPDGQIWVQRVGVGGSQDGNDAIDARDSVGNLLWQKALPKVRARVARGLADGTVAVAGSKSGDGWWARFDGNGYSSCASSGICFAKPPDDCDDKNPCTADTCDGKLGCQHVLLVDGAACLDASSCKVLQTCLAGKCQGGKDKLFSKNFADGEDIYGVLPLADGGFVISGHTGNFGWRVERLDAAGAMLWTQGDDVTGQGRGATIGGDGSIYQAGFEPTGAHVRKLDVSTGKTAWIKVFGGANDVFSCAATGPTGNIFIAGLTPSSGGIIYELTGALDGDSKPVVVANGIWSDGGKNEGFFGVRALPDGGAIAAGLASGSGKHKGVIVRFDANLKPKWDAQTSLLGESDLMDVAPMTDGSFLAVGSADNYNAGALFRVDAAGKVVLEKKIVDSKCLELRSVVPTAGGLWYAVGRSGTSALLLQFDANGNVLWVQSYAKGSNNGFETMAPTPDGGLILAGRSDNANAMWTVRTDAFGHATCAESGTCIAKAAADCDDKNPCTADTCDAVKSCQHVNLADASPCGGGKACKAGACQ